ncbi:hypothetical protein [Massilia endophytica]|uniref:hypothetical protein n=1 Tax=Massilia endophytica TaxID=2899220 RepID=UPI001E3951E8|nr:hypothetical protein [Massilia endophytica]UGQ48726.1 hypothetical protein LSQ66_09770 [Massilia endophytica]
MNYSSHSPYGVSQATLGPSPTDIRRWTRVLRAKLRRIFEFWGAPFVDGRFPPC